MTKRAAELPTGLALYVRRFDSKRHGSAAQLMRRMKDHGASWVAVAGPWDDDPEGLRFINRPDTCHRLLDAAAEAGLDGYVWGYPFLGREAQFVEAITRCAGASRGGLPVRILLDPELGANPTRAARGAGFRAAEAGASRLVSLLGEAVPAGSVCGLSTYGSALRFRWFPLTAYTQALSTVFPSRCFIGGQTYTEDSRIDASIADFVKLASQMKVPPKVVPNFGVYQKTGTGYRAKTALELDAHFLEFINEQEPVDALIGWAENFMTPELWRSFAKMSDLMKRGATKL